MAGMVAQSRFVTGGLNADNREIALVASGAYDTTANVEFDVDPRLEVVEVVVVATAIVATPSVTFDLQAFDIATATWESVVISAAVTAVSKTTLQANPFTPAVTNVSAQRVPARRMRVVATHGDADALTFGITVRGL